MRVRCADGPFAGATLTVHLPYHRVDWESVHTQIMWIAHGPDRHAYTLAENRDWGGYRLVYRDTF